MRPDSRILALAAGNFALGSATMSIVGLLNEISHDLQLPIAQAGQLASASHLVAAFVAPVMAFATGQLQRRTVMLAALAIGVAAQFGAALALGFWTLFAARMIFGFSMAMQFPTAVATSTLLAKPEQRGAAVSTVMLGNALATVIGVPLGIWFGGLLGWRATMYATSVVIFLALTWIAMTIPRELPKTKLDLAMLSRTFRHRGVRATLLIMIGVSTSHMVTFAYIAPQLRFAVNAGPNTIALLMAILGVCATLGSLVAVRFMDRVKPLPMTAYSTAMMIAAMLLWPLSDDSYALCVLMVCLWGAGSMTMFTSTSALMVSMSHELASFSVSLGTSMNFLGNVLGAGLGGILVAAVGLEALPWMSILIYGAVLCAIPSLNRQMKAQKTKDDSRGTPA